MQGDTEEKQQRLDEQNRQWDENQKKIRRMLERLDALSMNIDSDESFHKAMSHILEQSFGVKVLNITEFDDMGEVFGRPDQVELDVIIKNGLLIICEIKSSMSRADVYVFSRKVKFYERLHQCAATRRIVITPMIRDDARRVAAQLDIEVFGYADEVKP